MLIAFIGAGEQGGHLHIITIFADHFADHLFNLITCKKHYL